MFDIAFHLSTCRLEACAFKNLHSGDCFWKDNLCFWWPFLKRCVFGDCFHQIRVDGRPHWRKKKSLFSNKNRYVWAGPKANKCCWPQRCLSKKELTELLYIMFHPTCLVVIMSLCETAVQDRADKGWAVKRARPSKKVWSSGLGLCVEMSLVFDFGQGLRCGLYIRHD